MILPHRPFVLIRHGQTDANRDGIISGRTEARLTETGREAARALADFTFGFETTVFTSPQLRAQETARLAFPSASAQIVEDLRERDWGIFEGLPIEQLPARTATPEGGEGWEAMLARIDEALSACVRLAGNTVPVIVAHSGVIRAARALTGLDFGGPSAPNTTPLLYTLVSGSWQEQPLVAARID